MTPTTTRGLLACGVVAGPLYIVVAVIQVLIRPGFDLTRHPLSLLSNGELGWIQIANFVVTGLLLIASAIGIRRVLHPGPAGTWGPALLGTYGVSLIAAGAFVADPMNGFPSGTPAGPPATISWHGLLHFLSGAVGFLGLIAACVVFARRFAAVGRRAWAAYSLATGVYFLAAFIGVASGAGQPGTNLAFGIAVVLGFAWISAISGLLLGEAQEPRPDVRVAS